MLYMCQMEFEDKRTVWMRPPSQKECVDAVQSTPDNATPLFVTMPWRNYLLTSPICMG